MDKWTTDGQPKNIMPLSSVVGSLSFDKYLLNSSVSSETF